MNPVFFRSVGRSAALAALGLVACGGSTGSGTSNGSGGGGSGGQGTQCKTDAECPQPGCAMCGAAHCVNGTCVFTGPPGSGGASNGGASNGGASSGGASSGGVPSSGGTGGGTGCPSTPPENGSACTPPWTATGTFGGQATAHCTWGDDPRPGCRTSALCDGGAWTVMFPRCGPPLPTGCDATPPASGSTCSDTSLQCFYSTGTRCVCSDCVGGSGLPVCQIADPPQWSCRDETAGGCPYPLPQAGSPCSTENQTCSLDCSSPIVCHGGVWQWTYCQSCCPVCAAPDTPIATPDGDRPIASLRVGDLVYSVEGSAIIAVPVLEAGHTRVSGHHVERVVMRGGAVLEISPGHPTADGRKFRDLAAGSLLDDQHVVESVELVPYRFDATYDILPASSTGTYFAAGALVGSTLTGSR